ncbi:MAG: MBL fold metallo-hydrolase, partial [Lentimicrobiaceae bacterium]|nr:MBL fold metallo-hydrolase [Lentimicrobiaceae bacterium]
KSWKTKSGYKIFQVLSKRGNSFLISTPEHNMLVDTGMSSAFKRLFLNINSLKLKNHGIDYLILTHTHFDHCQNAAKIKEQEHCKIIVSEKEKDFAGKGYTPLPKGTTLVTDILSRIGKRLSRKWFGYKPFKPDILIDEEYNFNDDNINIKLFKTEGHTAGSISVIVDNEIAIVGDAMFGVNRNSVFPPFSDNQKEMIKSWNKLLNSDCVRFLPGHGKEIEKELLKKEFDKYAQKHSIDRY